MSTILVVEDGFKTQEIIKELLENEGHKILQARTLDEAIYDFNAYCEKLDCVLMDQSLDRKSTDNLVLKIKASGFSKPLIAFANDSEARKKQMQLGCNWQLDKNSSNQQIVKFFKDIIKK